MGWFSGGQVPAVFAVLVGLILVAVLLRLFLFQGPVLLEDGHEGLVGLVVYLLLEVFPEVHAGLLVSQVDLDHAGLALPVLQDADGALGPGEMVDLGEEGVLGTVAPVGAGGLHEDVGMEGDVGEAQLFHDVVGEVGPLCAVGVLVMTLPLCGC